MDRTTAIVFAGGEYTQLDAERNPVAASVVIAADSGYDAALAAGRHVDLLVGDLDSISEAGIDHARKAGIEIDRHPANKDATDLELALRAATERGATAIVVLGGTGGRFDHLIGNTLLLGASFLNDVDVRWEHGTSTVLRARPGTQVTVTGSGGDIVSLLPMTEDVAGVTTSGLRWALADARIQLGSTHGVSNEMVGARATVSIATGVLLIVHERSVAT